MTTIVMRRLLSPADGYHQLALDCMADLARLNTENVALLAEIARLRDLQPTLERALSTVTVTETSVVKTYADPTQPTESKVSRVIKVSSEYQSHITAATLIDFADKLRELGAPLGTRIRFASEEYGATCQLFAEWNKP